jgi:hypothetical protein
MAYLAEKSCRVLFPAAICVTENSARGNGAGTAHTQAPVLAPVLAQVSAPELAPGMF